MSCNSTYSPPITIPSGTVGPAGPAGADGTGGAAILLNTTGTDYTASVGGDASLVTYSLTGGTVAIGDILEISALFHVTAFTGTVYVKFGTATVSTHAFSATDAPIPDPTGIAYAIELKAKIHIKTLATETALSERLFYGNPTTQINTIGANIAENTSNAVVIDARVSNVAGSAVLKSFTVIHNQKV